MVYYPQKARFPNTMKTLHKLFFETKMTWWRVILFAVATAIVAAALLVIPFTKGTSLANIGVTFECWILFALIIVCNCETPLEAGLKVFVFFLISQPLIYLLQVPFSWQGWALFRYYPRWGLLTLATFPGAMIAWFVKKDNILSALILAIATGFLAYQAVYFAQSAILRFPHNLLSAIFCAVLAVLLPLVILSGRKDRRLTLLLTLLAALLSAVMILLPALTGHSGPLTLSQYYLGDGVWEITETDGALPVSLAGEGGCMLSVDVKSTGEATVRVRNDLGEEATYLITVADGEAVFTPQ